MNCRETRRLLVAYINDEVTPSERALLQRHLRICPQCNCELQQTQRLSSFVRDGMKRGAGTVRPAPDAWRRLNCALAAAAPRRAPRFLLASQRVGSSAFAAMLLVWALFGAFRVPSTGAPDPTAMPLDGVLTSARPAMTGLLAINLDLPMVRTTEAREIDEFLAAKREMRLSRRNTGDGPGVTAQPILGPRELEFDDDVSSGPHRLRRAQGTL